MSKRIRVAVDARPLEGSLSGIGQYTFFLLQALCALDTYEWFLLSNHPLDQYELLKHSHVHGISSGLTFPKAGTCLSQTRFPFWCSRNTINLFWSPRHHLPLALSPRVVPIVTVHDIIWKMAPETMVWGRRMLEALLMPSSLRKAHHIIVDSHSTKNDIIEHFTINPKKLSVIPLGPTVNTVKTSQSHQGKPYILFIGTMEPRKNLPRLLTAYQQLPTGLRQKYDLVIVGGQGWGRDNIRTLSEKLRITDKVQIKGYLKQEEMAAMLAHAEMLAMPSLYEGFGLPLLDAMTLGVPVMCSNISSMPEVTGKAALLIEDPRNCSSMRNAMERLLTDGKLKESLIGQGYEQAKQFSWQRTAVATTQVFENAVKAASSTCN